MSDQPRILIIDDDEDELEVLEPLLDKHFIVSSLEASDNLVTHIKNTHPDLVLINPETKGLPLEEVCNAIKRETKNPGHIIFLSTIQNIDESVWAFQCGADDFIGRPYEPEVVLSKIKVQVKQRADQRMLASFADRAREAAERALKSTSDMGVVLHFMSRMTASTYYDDLGLALIELIEAFGFRASIQIRSSKGALNLRCSNGSLDAQLLSQDSHKSENVCLLGDSLFLATETISILVKGCVSKDDREVERLKSKVTIILESVNLRVKQLDASIALEELEEEHEEDQADTTSAEQSPSGVDRATQNIIRKSSEKILQLREKNNEARVKIDNHDELTGVLKVHADLYTLHDLFVDNESDLWYKIEAMKEQLISRIHLLGMGEEDEEELLQTLDDALLGISQSHESRDAFEAYFLKVIKDIDALNQS